MNESLLLFGWDESANFTSESSRSSYSIALIIVATLSHGLVAVLALAGNTLVIWTVCARKPMKSAENYLIVSIAIADILLTVLYVPLLLLSLMKISWPFNSFSCKLFVMIPTMMHSVTQISLMAVSIVWFKIVVCPSQMPLTKRKGGMIAIAIWAVCFFVAIPNWTYTRVEIYHELDVYCVSYWPKPPYMELMYFVVYSCWSYFFPALWFISTYIIIMDKLFRTYSLVGRWHDDVDGLKHNKESVKMMIVVTTIQLICWCPLILMEICSKFVGQMNFSQIILVLVQWCAISSTMWKPIIYLTMSEKFRKNVKETCGWFPCIKTNDY